MTSPTESQPPGRDATRMRSVLTRAVLAARSPIPMQLLGRALLRAALVGVAAGLIGSLFFAGVEVVQQLVLERLCGYVPLRAAGERITGEVTVTPFRPWLVWLMPALGALGAGLLSRLAPEIRGGGADAIIEAFHSRRGYVRRRVPLLKGLASVLTLGFGGSGGREGPTMQMGGAIGSIIGSYLRVTDRERRILLVAGTAAGMAAVFRTPLGAALLAVEVLHRDDFETEALIPSVLASVVAYSVFVVDLRRVDALRPRGEVPVRSRSSAALRAPGRGRSRSSRPCFSRFCAACRARPRDSRVQSGPSRRSAVSCWAPRPFPSSRSWARSSGTKAWGSASSGAAMARRRSGSPVLDGSRPDGSASSCCCLLGLAKIIATSLTVGSGGSAGDFGPSLVIGGIFGGAFGRAAQLLLHDPRIDPGAFALVGMGTLYGGLAHVPIASLVMVCELAGSYDLLVPLMLATGISFIALRNRSLYHAQRPSWRESPAHRDELLTDVLRDVRVSDVMVKDRPFVVFERDTPAADVIQRVAAGGWQDVFPVLSADRSVVGVVTSDVLRTVMREPELADITIADDLMLPPIVVGDGDDVNSAVELLLLHGVREIVVVNDEGRVVGFLDEAEVTKLYRASSQGAATPAVKAR